MPHALHATAREFGDLVTLDTFTLADCQGNIKLFLNIIDAASCFGLTLELASRNPLVVWETFVNGWCMWASFPTTLVDGGSEFEAGFREEAEGIPITMKTTAAETSQQNSICERRCGIWKASPRLSSTSTPSRSSTTRGPSGPSPSAIGR